MKNHLLIVFLFVSNFSNAQRTYGDFYDLTIAAEKLISESRFEEAIQKINLVENYKKKVGCGNAWVDLNIAVEAAYKNYYIKQEKYWQGLKHLDSSEYILKYYDDFKPIQKYKAQLFNNIYLNGELSQEIQNQLIKREIISFEIDENKRILLVKIKTKDVEELNLYYILNKKKVHNKKQAIDFALKNLENQDLYKFLNHPK